MTDPETPSDESETGRPFDDSDEQSDDRSGEESTDEPIDDELTDDEPTDAARLDASGLRAYLDRALLVAFLLLGVVAALQFYLQTGAAIEVWVADPYEPVVKAAFNLAVLLLAAAGLSYQLRRVGSIRPQSESVEPIGPTDSSE